MPTQKACGSSTKARTATGPPCPSAPGSGLHLQLPADTAPWPSCSEAKMRPREQRVPHADPWLNPGAAWEVGAGERPACMRWPTKHVTTSKMLAWWLAGLAVAAAAGLRATRSFAMPTKNETLPVQSRSNPWPGRVLAHVSRIDTPYTPCPRGSMVRGLQRAAGLLQPWSRAGPARLLQPYTMFLFPAVPSPEVPRQGAWGRMKWHQRKTHE